jgi:rubrerythrin
MTVQFCPGAPKIYGGEMVEYFREEKYTRPKDLKELLQIARQREVASAGFYEDMSKFPFANFVFELIEELKKAELGHIKMIENKLAEVEKLYKK